MNNLNTTIKNWVSINEKGRFVREGNEIVVRPQSQHWIPRIITWIIDRFTSRVRLAKNIDQMVEILQKQGIENFRPTNASERNDLEALKNKIVVIHRKYYTRHWSCYHRLFSRNLLVPETKNLPIIKLIDDALQRGASQEPLEIKYREPLLVKSEKNCQSDTPIIDLRELAALFSGNRHFLEKLESLKIVVNRLSPEQLDSFVRDHSSIFENCVDSKRSLFVEFLALLSEEKIKSCVHSLQQVNPLLLEKYLTTYATSQHNPNTPNNSAIVAKAILQDQPELFLNAVDSSPTLVEYKAFLIGYLISQIETLQESAQPHALKPFVNYATSHPALMHNSIFQRCFAHPTNTHYKFLAHYICEHLLQDLPPSAEKIALKNSLEEVVTNFICYVQNKMDTLSLHLAPLLRDEDVNCLMSLSFKQNLYSQFDTFIQNCVMHCPDHNNIKNAFSQISTDVHGQRISTCLERFSANPLNLQAAIRGYLTSTHYATHRHTQSSAFPFMYHDHDPKKIEVFNLFLQESNPAQQLVLLSIKNRLTAFDPADLTTLTIPSVLGGYLASNDAEGTDSSLAIRSCLSKLLKTLFEALPEEDKQVLVDRLSPAQIAVLWSNPYQVDHDRTITLKQYVLIALIKRAHAAPLSEAFNTLATALPLLSFEGKMRGNYISLDSLSEEEWVLFYQLLTPEQRLVCQSNGSIGRTHVNRMLHSMLANHQFDIFEALLLNQNPPYQSLTSTRLQDLIRHVMANSRDQSVDVLRRYLSHDRRPALWEECLALLTTESSNKDEIVPTLKLQEQLNLFFMQTSQSENQRQLAFSMVEKLESEDYRAILNEVNFSAPNKNFFSKVFLLLYALENHSNQDFKQGAIGHFVDVLLDKGRFRQFNARISIRDIQQWIGFLSVNAQLRVLEALPLDELEECMAYVTFTDVEKFCEALKNCTYEGAAKILVSMSNDETLNQILHEFFQFKGREELFSGRPDLLAYCLELLQGERLHRLRRFLSFVTAEQVLSSCIPLMSFNQLQFTYKKSLRESPQGFRPDANRIDFHYFTADYFFNKLVWPEKIMGELKEKLPRIEQALRSNGALPPLTCERYTSLINQDKHRVGVSPMLGMAVRYYFIFGIDVNDGMAEDITQLIQATPFPILAMAWPVMSERIKELVLANVSADQAKRLNTYSMERIQFAGLTNREKIKNFVDKLTVTQQQALFNNTESLNADELLEQMTTLTPEAIRFGFARQMWTLKQVGQLCRTANAEQMLAIYDLMTSAQKALAWKQVNFTTLRMLIEFEPNRTVAMQNELMVKTYRLLQSEDRAAPRHLFECNLNYPESLIGRKQVDSTKSILQVARGLNDYKRIHSLLPVPQTDRDFEAMMAPLHNDQLLQQWPLTAAFMKNKQSYADLTPVDQILVALLKMSMLTEDERKQRQEELTQEELEGLGYLATLNLQNFKLNENVESKEDISITIQKPDHPPEWEIFIAALNEQLQANRDFFNDLFNA